MISVLITAKELNRFDNEVLKGDFVLKKLRRADIPVIGALWPRGAHGGKLTMAADDGGDLLFTWDGEAQQLW